MTNVEDFLKSKEIEYVQHEHPPVYTGEDLEKYCGNVPGLACKNLFLRDKKGKRFFLVVLPVTKRTDLKRFAEIANTDKVSFANQEVLMEKLGLEAGAVSPFGLLNDKNSEVEVYIDSDVFQAEVVSFHPNRNTASLELTGKMFLKYLSLINNQSRVIDW